MDEDDIDDLICMILRIDGPDRHIDGHDVLTDFVMALLDGRGDRWRSEYLAKHAYDVR